MGLLRDMNEGRRVNSYQKRIIGASCGIQLVMHQKAQLILDTEIKRIQYDLRIKRMNVGTLAYLLEILMYAFLECFLESRLIRKVCGTPKTSEDVFQRYQKVLRRLVDIILAGLPEQSQFVVHSSYSSPCTWK